MENKFYGCLDAAEFAATITNEWKDAQSGEIYDKKTLFAICETSDDENPLDEDDEDSYYIVSDAGAIGITDDAGESVDWCFIPVC